ncbi:Putative long-chain-fatty-acid--CoA ligase [Chlamydiales bacterium SCGC AG-110-M15]|nr:Putative long-chain-fatty-acid--CoA ligase [Chlamydiales bacterium SCGC AG-110-M15]
MFMEEYETLPSMIRYVMNTYRNSFAFNYKEGKEWKHMSTEMFIEKIRRLSLGLKSLGLQKGESVGLLARPSPYWLVIDFAIMMAGGISVPLFPYVSQKNFLYQVADANMRMLFVVGQDLWSTYDHHQEQFRRIVTLDVLEADETTMDIRHVMTMGDRLSVEDPTLYMKLGKDIMRDDIATIIYTSGSTGRPKGVELTHKNFISQIRGGHVRIFLDPRKDRALSSLPLAHVFERALMYYYISSGISIYFVDDIRNVAAIAREVKPTITTMVPRLLEKIYAKMENSIEQSGRLKRGLATWAFDLASLTHPNLFQRLQRTLANKLVYKKLLKSLGGEFRAIIVGGASLNPDLCRFFLNAGFPVFQGYGMTETSPIIAANFPGHNKVGTVGPLFPYVEVSIAKNGEILTRGPSVMRGYHNRPNETQKTIDEDGWLHTGDTGKLDEDGYLTVTGRVKEIFKTSGGKYVSPIPIEQALTKLPLIDMAMVVAEGRRFTSTLLFPDLDVLKTLKEKHEDPNLTNDEFLDSDFIRDEVSLFLTEVNSKLSRWEKVRKYRFTTAPLSVERGEMTPTLKIRRKAVEEKYKHLIDTMYHERAEETEEKPVEAS